MAVVGIAEVLISPVFTGAQRKIASEFGKTMPKAGRAAGKDLGAGMAAGFSSETAGLEAEAGRMAKAVSQAEGTVAASKGRLASASAAESKALGDLRVAELKLQEVRQNSSAKASKVAAAEEKLSVMQQRAAAATTNRETADRNHAKATNELGVAQGRAAEAAAKLETHMRQAGDESERTGSRFGRLGAALGNAFRGSPLASMVSGMRRDTDRAEADFGKFSKDLAGASARGGRAVLQGFAVVGTGLAAILPAAGAAGSAVVSAAGNVLTLAASLTTLAGVAALVPAGLMAVGAGAGVLVAAFSGIGDALKAATEQKAQAAGTAQLNAMAMADAARSVERAERSAAESQVQAARRVEDAKKNLASVVAQNADQQAAAVRRVADAEKGVERANRNVLESQQALNDARAEAVQRVEDLTRSLERAGLGEREASLRYEDALAAFNSAVAGGADASSHEMRRLQLDLDQAAYGLKTAKEDAENLRVEQAQASKEGVQGNKQVIKAEQSLADARDAATEAVQAREDAVREVAKVEQEGAQRVAEAQQAIADATEQAARTQHDSAESVADAYRALERVQLQQADAAAAANQKSVDAMAKLTPAAQTAVGALLSVYDQLGKIRQIAQESFFKGFAGPLLSLAGGLMPQLATGVGAIASALGDGAQIFMGSLEKALGGGVLDGLLQGVATNISVLNRAIDPIVQSFTTLGVVGMKYMPQISDLIVKIADKFNGFIQAAAADGRLDKWIQDGIQGLKDLWSIADSIGGIFSALNDAAKAGGFAATLGGLAGSLRDVEGVMKGPVFQTTMATIFQGAADGAKGLQAAIGPIGDAFTRGAPALAEFLKLGGEIAGTFIGGIFTAFSDPAFGAGLNTFMGGLQQGVEAVAPHLPGMAAAFGSLLTALAPIAAVVGPALVQVITALADGLSQVITFLSPLLVAVVGSPVAMGILIGLFMAAAAAAGIMATAAAVSRVIVVGSWIAMGAAAIVSGAQTAAIWALYVAEAIGGAIQYMIQSAYVVAAWVSVSAAAVASGIKTAAAWLWGIIAPAAAGAISFMISAATVVGGWVLMGIQSMLAAGRMALAWLIALGPIGIVIAAVIGLAAIIIANWDTISTWTRDMWEKYVKPVFDNLAKFITEDVPNAFEKGVKWIGEAWGKLQDLAKAPVKFVVDTVINKGLIDGLNGIGSFLKLPAIPHIELPQGFSDGGYTGPGGKYQPAGIVHAGEIVWSQDDISRWGGVGVVESLRKAAGYAMGGLVRPIRNAVISQPFSGSHNGIDFAAPTGTDVDAAGPGRVSSAGWSQGGGGNEIHIDHPNGLQTWYAHLSSFAVKLGDMVSGGQLIGKVGSTGNSTGPHLHYMVLNGGWPNYMNPAPYLDGGGEAGSQGGGWNPIAGIIDGLVDGFRKAFPAAGFIADLAIGAGKKLLDGAVDFVTGNGGKDKGIGSTGLPYLHDQGGVLNPGLSSIVNATRKPEAILNAQQWSDIHRLATSGGQGGRGDIHFNGPVGWDPHEVANRIETKRRDTFAAFGI
ncbi:peptidoglycan DD-metalloendopeptidase family protein [Pseudarthrobacter sp. LT1]|uniref:peptidoglycan DD-metalloendopeptidase family protein n=1 Tax=Pseudarthrobacter sp. LT1 TaxID=3111450 RepID=UPI002D79E50A|nr:peptidoglycan DD-metalloendopeptidase family protein [Pseudarthrobacter sp. LT1]WRT14654.1 peptidoglycan DD-metalloendopeptidase family protein [Pseudarthrobacter sp. LT1]